MADIDVGAVRQAGEGGQGSLITPEEGHLFTFQAPVLLVPGAFDRDFCRYLIRVWEEEGHGESGFMRAGADGVDVGVIDHSIKIRQDHFVPDGPVKDAIRQRLAATVVPSIRKAFAFQVTRFEDLRIACYDAERGGFFRVHTDNAQPATAHRVFAMSLNLNAEEHEGGYLHFPEFGPNLYRPGTGDAVVFSCSLAHEAMDVTAGRRFVLLTFFYNEEGARLRDEYSRRAGLAYRA